MKLLSLLGGGALLLIAIFVFLLFFSASESQYRCNGSTANFSNTRQAQVFLKLQRYRWWVGLWNKSAGAAWLEVPNSTLVYYSKLELTGDILWLGSNADPIQGSFSTLSKALQVDIPGDGMFRGKCVEIKR